MMSELIQLTGKKEYLTNYSICLNQDVFDVHIKDTSIINKFVQTGSVNKRKPRVLQNVGNPLRIKEITRAQPTNILQYFVL
jgi:hypothetical protein